MRWILIGLMCNSLKCYWLAPISTEIYDQEDACLTQAALEKKNTAMYSDVQCAIKGNQLAEPH